MQRGDAIAERLVGLNVNLPRAIEIGEVVDVERGQVNLERIEDVVERDADRFGLAPIDVNFDLRRVDAKLGEDVHQARILCGRSHDPKRRFRKRRQPEVGAILELELEAAEARHAVDGRRIDGKDLRLWYLREEAVVDAVNNGVDRVAGTFPLAPRLQQYENQAAVRGAALRS